MRISDRDIKRAKAQLAKHKKIQKSELKACDELHKNLSDMKGGIK